MLYSIPHGMAEWVEHLAPVLEDWGICTSRVRIQTLLEPWSSQTNDFTIDACHFLAWRSALLGQGKDWLAQCLDNVTELDGRSWCWRPGLPLMQHYKDAMSVHCQKSVSILIWPLMFLGCKTTTSKQIYSVRRNAVSVVPSRPTLLPSVVDQCQSHPMICCSWFGL